MDLSTTAIKGTYINSYCNKNNIVKQVDSTYLLTEVTNIAIERMKKLDHKDIDK